jgi:hypothetical protein
MGGVAVGIRAEHAVVDDADPGAVAGRPLVGLPDALGLLVPLEVVQLVVDGVAGVQPGVLAYLRPFEFDRDVRRVRQRLPVFGHLLQPVEVLLLVLVGVSLEVELDLVVVDVTLRRQVILRTLDQTEAEFLPEIHQHVDLARTHRRHAHLVVVHVADPPVLGD